MTAPREAHVQALMLLMKCVMSTEKRGLLLTAKEKLSIDHKFKVHGRSTQTMQKIPMTTEACKVAECS